MTTSTGQHRQEGIDAGILAGIALAVFLPPFGFVVALAQMIRLRRGRWQPWAWIYALAFVELALILVMFAAV